MAAAAPTPKVHPSWLNADPLPHLEPKDAVGGRVIKRGTNARTLRRPSQNSTAQDGAYKLPSQLAAGAEVEEDSPV